MNARNNYLMNTLVLVSPDTDTARKSGIGYLDLRFPVRSRLPTILNRHRFALSLLFSFSSVPPFSLLFTFSPSFLPLSLSLSFPLSFTARENREGFLRDAPGWFRRRLAYQLCPKRNSLFPQRDPRRFNVLRGAIDVSPRGLTPSPRIRASNARII